jgi:hypothetical protein
VRALAGPAKDLGDGRGRFVYQHMEYAAASSSGSRARSPRERRHVMGYPTRRDSAPQSGHRVGGTPRTLSRASRLSGTTTRATSRFAGVDVDLPPLRMSASASPMVAQDSIGRPQMSCSRTRRPRARGSGHRQLDSPERRAIVRSRPSPVGPALDPGTLVAALGANSGRGSAGARG